MVSQEKHFNVLSKSEGLCALGDLRLKPRMNSSLPTWIHLECDGRVRTVKSVVKARENSLLDKGIIPNYVEFQYLSSTV